MAKLLTSQDYIDIRAAVQDVTDTFFVTSCIVEHFIVNFGEFNQGSSKNFVEYNLLCLYEDDTAKTEKDLEGSKSNYGVKLSFNMADMPNEVLTPENLTIFNDNTDYVTVKGNRFKIDKISYDAPLDEKDLLMIIYCERLQNEV